MARRAPRKSPPNELQARVGRLLKAYREEKDITQAELAERSGTTEERVIAYEKGRRWPMSDTLLRLLSALQVPEDEFFDEVAEASRRARDLASAKSDVYEGVRTGSEIADRKFAGEGDGERDMVVIEIAKLEHHNVRLEVPASRLRIHRRTARRPGHRTDRDDR